MRYKVGDRIKITPKQPYEPHMWAAHFIFFLEERNWIVEISSLRSSIGVYCSDGKSSTFLLAHRHFKFQVIGRKKLRLNLTR